MALFTLRQLEYAWTIATEGGIAQASRRLNISQPSVAQALDKLEDMTSLILFERHHARGVTPTAEGRRFLASVRGLLDHAERLEREAAALAAHSSGEIRIGCFSTIAGFCLPGLIRALNLSYPGIEIRASEGTLDALPRRVREQTLDACLTYDIADQLDGLDRHDMMEVRPVVILPSQHPLAGQERIALADLANDPYVLYDAPGSREYYAELLRSAGLSPRIGYASQSLEGVRSAVAAGFGFSIVAFRPSYDMTYEGKQLVTRPVEDRLPALKVVIATGSTERDNPLIEKFVGCARLYFSGSSAV